MQKTKIEERKNIIVSLKSNFGVATSLGIITGAVFSHLLVLGINVGGDGGALFALAVVVFICSSIFLYLHKAEVFALIKTNKKVITV